MSGVEPRRTRDSKGAADAIAAYVRANGPDLAVSCGAVDAIARTGGTPLVVAERARRSAWFI
jgi:high-affinity K+ transport system ATPase subunit B